jgi:hypothetical protein
MRRAGGLSGDRGWGKAPASHPSASHGGSDLAKFVDVRALSRWQPPEGKMGATACWCTTGDPLEDVHMSLDIKPPSPSRGPAGACNAGCAFTCP